METNSNCAMISNNQFSMKKVLWCFFVLTLLATVVLCGEAFADNVSGGESDTAVFSGIKDKVVNYMTGSLGALISLSLVLCGGFVAVKTQSFWAFIMGVVMAIGFANAPTIIDNVMSDTLSDVTVVQVQNEQVVNKCEPSQKDCSVNTSK